MVLMAFYMVLEMTWDSNGSNCGYAQQRGVKVNVSSISI